MSGRARASPRWCPLQSARVDANFKETQLGRVRVGQPVHIRVDAWPDRDIVGTVESLSPASGSVFSLLPPDNATGNFTKIVQRLPVRVRVPEAVAPREGLLRPGSRWWCGSTRAASTRRSPRPDRAASGGVEGKTSPAVRTAGGEPKKTIVERGIPLPCGRGVG